VTPVCRSLELAFEAQIWRQSGQMPISVCGAVFTISQKEATRSQSSRKQSFPSEKRRDVALFASSRRPAGLTSGLFLLRGLSSASSSQPPALSSRLSTLDLQLTARSSQLLTAPNAEVLPIGSIFPPLTIRLVPIGPECSLVAQLVVFGQVGIRRPQSKGGALGLQCEGPLDCQH